MANPNYIQQQWESFSKAVKLEETSPTQRREMRIAFFAGSKATIDTMMCLFDDTGNPDDVTAADERVMEHIYEEFEKFQSDARAGKGN